MWVWWAWRDGAFFGVVFYPGAIVLYAVLLVALWVAPWRGSLNLSRGAAIALTSFLLLGAWTLISTLWSPAVDVALGDALRAFLYAAAFGIGLWATQLLAGRMLWSLIPLATAGAIVGVATLVTLLGGDDIGRYLEADGTLRTPLGYRNATAAFFFIVLWPALTLASSRELDWRVRGAALGTAALCLELAVMGQSRGSLPAAALALGVYLVTSRRRVRAAAWVGLAAVPAAAALPWLLDVYVPSGSPSISALRDAAWAAAFSSLVAVAAGLITARLDSTREPLREERPGRWQRRAAPALAAALLACLVIAIAQGGVLEWLDQRVGETRTNAQPSRFGFGTGGQHREDFWRVAVRDARDAPALGTGAGGFQHSYLLDRESDETPRDAHSVELELLGELGVPGLALFVCGLAGAAAGALRFRRLGPAAAALSAGALASGTYWLAHASIDWFWAYPALTAPTLALLGSGCAPAVLAPAGEPSRRWRPAAAAAAVALAAVSIPLYLSERYTNDAYRHWGSDLSGAYAALDRAADLNPLSDEPLLAEGAIAREAGDRERAIDAFRAAGEREPEQWAAHYFLGLLLTPEDPAAAREELATARRLNPRGEGVRRAQLRLRRRARRPPARGAR